MLGLWRLKLWWKRRQKGAREKRALNVATSAVAKFPQIQTDLKSGLQAELIISLTSYPPRFPVLANTIKGLLDQRMRADKVVLWLAEDDITQLPYDVSRLVAHGLEIRTCSDLKSYKKIIPSLKAYPEAFLVIADDDTYYDPNWLESLVETYLTEGPGVVAGRAHLARFRADGSARPYLEWEFDTSATKANTVDTAIFATGCGGVLYPPGALPEQTMDEDLFMNLCPHGDDIWLFYMQRMAGVRQLRISRKLELTAWEHSQDSALWHSNYAGGGNDLQIQAVEAYLCSLAASS
jgi:hypothetical protein